MLFNTSGHWNRSMNSWSTIFGTTTSYAKNAVYDHGHHGNAILSKSPITSWKQEDISTNRFEQRGILKAEIEIPLEGRDPIVFHAYCLHLNMVSAKMSQYRDVMYYVKSESAGELPIVAAGYFNDWNNRSPKVFIKHLKMKEVYKTLYGSYAKTFPFFLPLFPLDRIYVRNVNVSNARVLRASRPSDHLPLFAEMKILS